MSTTPPRHDLYRRPVPLDSSRHAKRRVQPLADWRFCANQHAAYLTVTEIPHAALEFAVVFVRDGDTVSPVVLLGLEAGENLFVDPATGNWRARYVPAAFRRYPFITSQAQPGQPAQVLVDESWPGFGEVEGEPLFGPSASPGGNAGQTPALARALEFLQRFEDEVARTRAFCTRLAELGVLEPMKVDATLPGERKLRVDGFEAVDEKRLSELPDATVLELFRNGMLGMLQLHLASVANVRNVVDRKGERELLAMQAASASGAAAAAPAPPGAPGLSGTGGMTDGAA